MACSFGHREKKRGKGLRLFPFSFLLFPHRIMSHPPFAAIGIYAPGQSKPSLMSARGRVIVFDHAEQARQYLPLLGGGRPTRWQNQDNVCWLPLHIGGVNRACVLTDYDPYALPPGLPVCSETHGREWRGHVHAAHVFHDCGQMQAAADSSWRNTAIE